VTRFVIRAWKTKYKNNIIYTRARAWYHIIAFLVLFYTFPIYYTYNIPRDGPESITLFPSLPTPGMRGRRWRGHERDGEWAACGVIIIIFDGYTHTRTHVLSYIRIVRSVAMRDTTIYTITIILPFETTARFISSIKPRRIYARRFTFSIRILSFTKIRAGIRVVYIVSRVRANANRILRGVWHYVRPRDRNVLDLFNIFLITCKVKL